MSVINNYNNSTLLSGTASADSICNYGSKVTINGGAGNDYLWTKLTTSNVTINGGAGADSIYSNGANSSANGGSGNDTIHNNGSNNVVDGGDGNDFLQTGYITSTNVTLNTGAGNDTVQIISEGKNVINVGEGDNLLRVFRDNELIVNGSDANESLLIQAYRENVSHDMPDIAMTINSSRGNDVILGFGNQSAQGFHADAQPNHAHIDGGYGR